MPLGFLSYDCSMINTKVTLGRSVIFKPTGGRRGGGRGGGGGGVGGGGCVRRRRGGGGGGRGLSGAEFSQEKEAVSIA